MTVRAKMLMIMGVTLVALMGAILATSVFILLEDNGRLELRETAKDLSIARDALENQMTVIGNMAGDYAASDETYQFLQDRNEAYRKSNLVDETFSENRLSFAVYADLRGRIVFGKAFDLSEQKEIPLPDGLAPHLAPDMPLLRHADTKSKVDGVLALRDGVYIVAARPIITGRYKGPIRGTLIFARLLDDEEAAELSRLTHLDLYVCSVDDPSMPEDMKPARAAILSSGKAFLKPLDRDIMMGCLSIKDIHGTPALLLRVRSPRESYKNFLESLRYFSISAVVVAVVLGLIGTLLTERMVISRLAKLTDFVKNVRTGGDLSSRLHVPGGDEISQLSSSVNGMLEALQRDTAERDRAQNALRESEAKYRELVESANSIILRMDVMGNVTFFNEFAEEYFGFTKDEIIGKNIVGTIVPAVESTGRDLTSHMRSVCERTSEYKINEQENVRRDGMRVWVSWTNRPILDADGRVTGILSVGSDITDRKRAEDELRQRQAKLESIFRAAPAGVGIAVNRVFVEVNDYLCRMLGYSRQELIGQSSRMIYPSDEDFQYVGREKYGQIERKGVGSVETRYRCKDGRIIDVLSSSSPIVPGDPAAGVSFIVLDITERKKAERALAQERNLLRTLIDIIPDCVYVLDAESRIVLSNPADLRVMGRMSFDEVAGKTDFDLFPRELAEEYYADNRRVLETGQPLVNKEEIIAVPGREPMWVLTTKVPLRDSDGKIIGIVGIGRNVTERRRAQQELARERNLLRTLIDIVPDCVYVMDRDCRKILSNPADLASMGVKSPDEVIGKTDFDIYPTEMAEEFYADDRRVIQTGEQLVNKEELVSRPGYAPKWILTTKVPLKDGQGHIVGLVGIGRDVTERRRALEALRESEERYKSLFNEMLNGYSLQEIILDADGEPCDYRFLDVNPAWEKITGLKREQVLGKTFVEVFKTVPGKDWIGKLGAVALTGKGMHFEQYNKILGMHMEVTAYCPRPGQFAVAFTDVTERRKAEEEIKSLRTQIDFILGATKTGIDIIDSGFNVRYIDPEWAKVYGDYRGRKCHEYFMGRGEPCPGCGIPIALKTRKVTVTEEILVRENDRPIQVTTLPYQDANGEWLVAEVNVDMSDRKRLEAQLLQAQKMDAIGQLAGGIAHDFNNLLTGILGYANMLKLDSAPGNDVYEAANTIEKAAERASELTKRLLGFARRGKFLRMPVDVHAIAQEVIRLLSRTLDKNIAIIQKFAPRSPWVMGDPDQIEQAILNLAVNARDAMPDGGELTIETQVVDVDESYCRNVPDASAGTYVKISVSDTGCGIPEELRQRIFEPFFTTKDQGKGTGMGLAMVYGIVKNHSGFVRLYSEVGQGTRFDVYLPLSDQSGLPSPSQAAAPVKGTGRILLIDDEDVVRDVAANMLRSLGYEVATVTSGNEAVEYYGQHSGEIDLAIIDLIMPGMGARECFKALKKTNPAVRAVLSSGYGLNGKAQETVDDGMCGFVQKPYTLADLSVIVSNALKR